MEALRWRGKVLWGVQDTRVLDMHQASIFLLVVLPGLLPLPLPFLHIQARVPQVSIAELLGLWPSFFPFAGVYQF
jgi:hypothetical protein